MRGIDVRGGEYLLSSNGQKLGRKEGALLTMKSSFKELTKRHCAWVIHEDILNDNIENISILIPEENGTQFLDLYEFEAKASELLAKKPQIIIDEETGLKKAILPISWFKGQTNNKEAARHMQQLGNEWFIKLRAEFHKDYMQELSRLLQEERSKYTIYPARPDVFRALRITPYSSIKVVAIGQNPYHNGLADGLAFSSLNPSVTPKSLENIFKEIESDVYNGLMLDRETSLDRWSRQGVLLINTSLTVREGDADSHFNLGWERFTSKIIEALYLANRPIVWLLWGNEAQNSFDEVISKVGFVNENHLVLRAAHPSPRSANKGFFGCKHFSKTNKFLESKNIPGVVW